MTAAAHAPPGRMISRTARQIAPWHLERTDRPRWLELRREGIGGSDVAPVCGLESYGSAWQVWLDKTQPFGPLPDDRSPAQAERMRWGHRAEAGAAEEFTLRHPGVKLTRIGMLQHAHQPWMRVNLDWRITGCEHGSPCLAEVKNRNQFSAREWDTGGDPDRVPDAAAAQTQWGLAITGYGHGHLLAVIGGGEMREFPIAADPDLQAILTEGASWFWHHHVLTGTPPPIDASERTGRILALLWDADPGKIITATPEIQLARNALEVAKDHAAAASAEVARQEHTLQAALGDAEIAADPETGKPVVTWTQNGTFNGARFREDHPGLFAACSLLVPKTDTKLLAELDPEIYRKYRARVLRLPAAPKDS